VRSVGAKFIPAEQFAELLGLDVLRDLLVVPPAGLLDQGPDMFGALSRPLQLGPYLGDRRRSAKLGGQGHLHPVVIGQGLDQELLLANRLSLRHERVLHRERHLGGAEALEVVGVGGRKGADRREQAYRSLLEEVTDGQAAALTGASEVEDHSKMRLQEARHGGFVGSTPDPLEEGRLFTGTQRRDLLNFDGQRFELGCRSLLAGIGPPRLSRPLEGGLGRHRRLIVSTARDRTDGRETAVERRRIYSRPLLHVAFPLAWQDELLVLAPLPAVVIANLAVDREWARPLNLAICAVAIFLTGASGLINLIVALSGREPNLLAPAILIGAAALAAPVLRVPVRARLARLLPFDAESPVALLALVAVILVVGLQANYQAGHDALAAVSASSQLQPIDVVGQELPLLLMALLGVGLFTRRSLPAVLDRLGVVKPAAWQVAAALAVAGLFLAVSQGAQELQRVLDPALADRLGQATSHYYGSINGWFGIAVIALGPGIAEEAFFRGALQPRLGIWVAALAFAAVHTQYALTVDTLLVFALGAGLGLVRRRLNTTSAMTAHAAYNALAGVGIPTALLPWAIPAEVLLVLVAIALWWGSRGLERIADRPQPRL